MAKAKKKQKQTKSMEQVKQEIEQASGPWISMRNGIFFVSIASIVMAVLTAIQTVPAKGWVEGLLWSVLLGALIWAIFWGLIFINRLLRR